MAFDIATLKGLTGTATNVAVQKGQELLGQINLLLKQLQDAGYEVGEMDAQLSVPPEITIHLKTGPRLNDAKLLAISQAQQNNDVVGLILGSLVQANKLREAIDVDTIELSGATIVLRTGPSITLEWKAKEKAASA